MVGVKVSEIVKGHEAADGRIIIPRFEEIQPGFGIEIVATVPEGVAVADEARLGVLRPVRVQNTAISPRVVCIFYHNRAAAVK